MDFLNQFKKIREYISRVIMTNEDDIRFLAGGVDEVDGVETGHHLGTLPHPEVIPFTSNCFPIFSVFIDGRSSYLARSCFFDRKTMRGTL